MANEVLFLGTGTSTGVPMIGCHCRVCESTNLRDKRLRTSVIVKTSQHKTFLIDTTPDLRTQLLDNSIENIDFVLLTHDHADHLHGIDDLRPLCFSFQKKSLPFYSLAEYEQVLKDRFPYIFQRKKVFNTDNPILGGGIPLISYHPLEVGSQNIEEVPFTFFKLPHGNKSVLGIQYEKMAYLVDCHKIPAEVIAHLKNEKLDLLIIDCLQEHDHKTHLSRKKCFDYIDEIAPSQAFLVHMSHHLGHEYLELKARKITKTKVLPAYDKLKIKF